MEEALQGKVIMMHAENNIGMIIKGVTAIAGMTGIITVILAADDGMTTAVEVPEVATLKKGTSFPSNSLLWTWTKRKINLQQKFYKNNCKGGLRDNY